MTSPAVFVLYLALVYLVVKEEAADHGVNQAISMQNIMESIQGLQEDVSNQNLKMKTTNNVYNDRVNIIDTLRYEISSYGARENAVDNVRKYDDIYTENEDVLERNLNIPSKISRYGPKHSSDHISKENNIYTSNKNRFRTNLKIHDDYLENLKSNNDVVRNLIPTKRVKRDEKIHSCDTFTFTKGKNYISHPHTGESDDVKYSGKTYCTTVISGSIGEVVQLTFLNVFHIEDHPECKYDYLEIRDGDKGYFNLLGKVCGDAFPAQITTSGPNAWLKFYSDDNIEYEGFMIQIDFIHTDSSVSIPESCTETLTGTHGTIESTKVNKDCLDKTGSQALDVLWRIEVEKGYMIYLNFTEYKLGQPNECDKNVVQVFGNVLEYDAKLVEYCGSAANPVTTKEVVSMDDDDEDQSNVMYVRLYDSRNGKGTLLNVTYTAYRALNPNEECDDTVEFDCEDSTCIDKELKCDGYAHCRLKADEEVDLCKGTTESIFQETGINVILSIFSVIMAGICSVCLYKCVKKLYNDHKAIKEHSRQSFENKLDSMIGSRLTLDAKRLQCDSEPRASLERDNHTNEMFKQQRKIPHEKLRPISIDSDYIPETYPNHSDDPWGGVVNDVPKTEEVRIERNGRIRSSDLSKKEDSIRVVESEERKSARGTSEVVVGMPDVRESECQTRDSLFQTDPVIKFTGSSTTNSKRISAVGHPPPQNKASDITIELIGETMERDPKPQKKYPERPTSTETTRSAPDVIIVAKPN